MAEAVGPLFATSLLDSLRGPDLIISEVYHCPAACAVWGVALHVPVSSAH